MANFKLFKINEYIILNLLFCLIPLSFIIGNFAINLNVFLLITISLLFFKSKIFKIKYELVDKLIISFFIFIIFTGLINTIEYFYILNKENLNNNKSLETIESITISFQDPIYGKTIFYLRYFFLYLVIRFLINEDKINFKWFFISCSIFCLFVSVDIFYQLVFSKDIFGIVSPDPNGLSGPFGDERIAGGYLHKFSIFSFFIFPFFFKFKKIYLSLISAALFIIFILAIILSGNRMILILYLMSIFLILTFEKKTRKYVPVSLISTIVIFYLFFSFNPTFKNHFNGLVKKGTFMVQIFVNENITKSWKIPGYLIPDYYQEFKTSYGTWLMNKYIGGGVRSFRINCWKRKVIQTNERGTCSTHPHNYYLEILTDLGLLGLMISSFIFFMVLYKSLIKKYFFKSGIPNIYASKLLIPFIFIFISEIFPIRHSGSFFSTMNSTYIFIIISVIVSLSHLKDKKIMKDSRHP